MGRRTHSQLTESHQLHLCCIFSCWGSTLQRTLPHNLVTSSHQPRDVRISTSERGYPRHWLWRAGVIRPDVCLSSSVPRNHLSLEPSYGIRETARTDWGFLLFPPFFFSDLLFWPLVANAPLLLAFQDLLAFPKSTLIKDWTESPCLVASRTAQLLAIMACSS